MNQFNSDQKIMRYPEKIDRFFSGDKTLIVTELDLTNKCNNKCPCCTGINQNRDSLTWNEIKQIISDLRTLDNKGIIMSGGGEPLIHPNFIDTLALIKSSGMSVGLNSNGFALTEKMANSILECCKYFRISLDAGTPQMYLKTHGMPASSFERVVENIRMTADIKKALNSNTSFGVGFLTGPDTIEDMESFVILMRDCGADFAQFRPFTGDKTDVIEKINELKQKYETETFKVAASLQKYTLFDKPTNRGYDKCRGMFFSTVITADAKVFACLHHRQNKEYLIGDMREGKTIVEIWNSYMKHLVYEKIDVSRCPPFCRNDSFNKTLSLLDMDIAHSEFL